MTTGADDGELDEGAEDSSAGARGRLDRWLWCARFFKSRTLASTAVSGGRVHLNGARVKPAHVLRPGDRIDMSVGARAMEVVVRGIPDRRGPAPEARRCYEETPESVARGIEDANRRRMAGAAAPRPAGRPDKRDRRRLAALARRQTEG